MRPDATRLRDEDAASTEAGDTEAAWSLGVAEAGRRISAGVLTPSDLLESVLARIDAVDGAIRSYVRVIANEARAEAARATAEIAAGHWCGPLHGVPFAVKDNYDVAGVPAAAGGRVRLGRIPDRDATLVAALRGAGAVLVGKLATWEYGTGDGGEYFDLPFPPARNPWDLSRFTGGSSTGAGAAVAAGTAPFALGSDTTGSVRLPAGACGVTGAIATGGRLSLEGVLPNCHSLDTPGPICRSAEDAATILGTLLGERDLARGIGAPVSGMRVAVVRDIGRGFDAADEPMRRAFERAVETLESLGVVLEEARLPTPAAECLAVTQMIGPAESAAIHEAELRERAGDLGRALRGKLLAGAGVRAVDYIQALRRRTEIAIALDVLMARFDALVTYGALRLPPRLGVEPEMTRFTLETMLTPFNLAGTPALVQRTGFSDEGLPTHWQIAAGRGREGAMLRLAAAYERTRPHDGWPDIPAAAPPPPAVAPQTGAPSADFRARAGRMALDGLSDADLGRMQELEAATVSRGAALPRPSAKEVRPDFGSRTISPRTSGHGRSATGNQLEPTGEDHG
ncbi:amidase [Pikeienuella piscinae]|uniref:Amidase n=1 Tax=Pikeienuella piscinae TaxID=2748098 RepID=A0A7L5C2Y6_9RHOB|nr:amidase [Pikeienuella piscinae]QIE56614.1 amidase [Pikeienuella piscinae]